MYIINLFYKVPLEKIDHHLADHISYLDQQYNIGNFLVSGKKVPRTGGVIMTKKMKREELLQIIQKDPFKQMGLADYEVTEFTPSSSCKELEFLLA